MNTLKKGFTLIELLIVIAILGVLAVVVLVAINPVQQLARTRDSGRISTVQQLGHAVEAFYVAHGGVYPDPVAWGTDLTDTGELTVIPAEVTNTLTSATVCDVNPLTGWCYDSATAPDSFAVWSALEADTNTNLCGGGATYTAYLSLAGRSCIGCGQPTSASTDAWCMN